MDSFRIISFFTLPQNIGASCVRMDEKILGKQRAMRKAKQVLYGMAKRIGGFEWARRKTKRCLRILCYHGFAVANETDFRPKLFISRDTFRRRLDLLNEYRFPVISLNEALTGLYEDTLPENAVVLTIDDGFWSVLAQAVPILKHHGFPATVYVTTYYSQKETPIFRLAVQYLFWGTTVRKADLAEMIGKDWRKVNLEDPVEKNRAQWAIIEYGEENCTEPKRQDLCRDLARVLQMDYPFLEKTRILSLLNFTEIASLERDGLDFQLHTHRHRFPDSNESLAKQEIQDNRAALQGVIRKPLKHFCYPSGVWAFHQRHWLKDLGIQSATTCDVGLNDKSIHPMGLRRFLDGENISQIEFEAEITGFADLIRRFSGKAGPL
jgi:peptidoglycan/xylan/chitin deacetylase (PgdA/CDA1 family)